MAKGFFPDADTFYWSSRVPGGSGEECPEAREVLENQYNGGAEVQRTTED
jgi:hypothetical protein